MQGKPEFDFQTEFLRRYPGLCLQCGHHVCVCPSVPESTVGRLSKELDLAPFEKLFDLNVSDAEQRGREIATSILNSVGGFPAIARRLPLDRGETNQAMVLLCLHLSDEIRSKNPELADKLREAAIRIGTDTKAPGTKSHANAPVEVVQLLSSVWPLLSLAAVPAETTLTAQIGQVLRAQTIRIGIVTALPKEFAAMRLMLDEERPSPVFGDPNDYILGTIPARDDSGSHFVVLTLLKEIGNNSAAAVATHLLRSFAGIQDVLMVGIAGGIPFPGDPDKHVRLGDIVLSNEQGVVQYDNLKIGTGKVQIRSSSAKPSARMTGAIRRLESDRLIKQYPWETLIPRCENLENGGRPPESADQVFDRNQVVSHPPDPTRRIGFPKLHYGRIGAANTLLKDPFLRDKVRQDCGVIAIEMEGSGIADATWTAGQSYAVIRGICDYCDDHKNDVWQGYAAVAAAAYARALIASISLYSYDLHT